MACSATERMCTAFERWPSGRRAAAEFGEERGVHAGGSRDESTVDSTVEKLVRVVGWAIRETYMVSSGRIANGRVRVTVIEFVICTLIIPSARTAT